jgi:hypothetical protein
MQYSNIFGSSFILFNLLPPAAQHPPFLMVSHHLHILHVDVTTAFHCSYCNLDPRAISARQPQPWLCINVLLIICLIFFKTHLNMLDIGRYLTQSSTA